MVTSMTCYWSVQSMVTSMICYWSVQSMITSMTCYLECSINGYFNDLLPGVFL